MKRPVPRLHYGWWIVVVTFCTLLVVAGIRSASGVLLVPLERDMGWTAVSISIAVAINVTLYGALGPFAAAFMETRGMRATILVALGTIAIAAALASFVVAPWQLALTWGVGVGAGAGMISMVLSAVISTRWFVTRRGLVYGVLTGASAAGQLVFLPLLAIIAQTFGWRLVGVACAAACALVAVPVFFFMRDRPESVGLRAFGAASEDGMPAVTAQHGTNPLRNTFAVLARASHSRDFWIVAFTFTICGATTNGYIGTHFMAMCGDFGMSQVHAAGLVAAIGVFSLIGSTAAGWLSDRYAASLLLFVSYLFRGLALFVLPFALGGSSADVLLPAFMVFYGLDWLSTGAPNVRALTEALGKEDTPIAFGWICVFHQLGAGASAFLAGYIRTTFGNYSMTFALYGMLCLVAAAASLAIGMGRTGARAGRMAATV